jgi:glycosyltransferase involved in cell wall biosynthesis
VKILHIVYECFPGSFAGGVQKMVLEVASAQAARGDEVEIWTIGKKSSVAPRPGLTIRYFPGRTRWSSAELRRTLAAGHRRFAVIHSHNTFLPLNLAVAAVARKGAKVFFHAHGALDPLLLSGMNIKALKKRLYVEALERRNYDAAQAVFGLTATECAQLAATGTRAAIFEVSNGIALQPAAPPVAGVGFRLQNRIAPNQPVVLFIGRITHKKGLHHLVEAMVAIRRQLPDTVLVICGGRDQDRDYVAALDAQITRLQLGPHVRWAGFANEEGKRAAFAACSVFAHPSYSEGMAMAVLEAMSFGVPTVVTPGCYMDRAVAAGALALAEQLPRSLTDVITGLLRDPQAAARLAARGREYVINHHSWPAIVARLSDIYAGKPEPAPYRSRV